MKPTKERIVYFDNRRSPDYLQVVQQVLDVDHLIETAMPVPPELQERSPHSRMCHISFLGISANTFFDIGRNYHNDGLPVLNGELEAVLAARERFESEGVWLRIQFLFVYPYSSYAMSMINAEREEKRSAINGKDVHPSYQQHFQVDEERFMASSLVHGLSSNLRNLQEMMERTSFQNRDGHWSLLVRFTPVSPNMCQLIINDNVFCDVYLLAKRHRLRHRLEFSSPLIHIKKAAGESDSSNGKSDDPYEAMLNHFRYLWQLNITMYCTDATAYDPRVPESLGRIKRPYEITLHSKRDHLLKKHRLDDANKWALKARSQFRRYWMLPQSANDSEPIFIACSWPNGSPHPTASNLRSMLSMDFRDRDVILEPTIVIADVGESLEGAVLGELRRSELAIVLLTRDYQSGGEGQFARPNLYFELGYLMRQFEFKGDRKRVFLARESGVVRPSNLNNFIEAPVIKEIERGQETRAAYELYVHVLEWLYKNSMVVGQDKGRILEALAAHEQRIIEAQLRNDKLIDRAVVNLRRTLES